MIVAFMKAKPAVFSNLTALNRTTKVFPPLKRILCIYYPISLKKNQIKTCALINFDGEVNTITWSYATKLGLKIYATNIRAQKTDSSTFKTFDIVPASFYIKNRLGRVRFFQEILLVTDISVNVILKIFFLTFSNANIVFKD